MTYKFQHLLRLQRINKGLSFDLIFVNNFYNLHPFWWFSFNEEHDSRPHTRPNSLSTSCYRGRHPTFVVSRSDGCAKQTLERVSEERPELNASPFHVSRGDVSFCDKPSFHARAIYRLSQAHDVIMQQLTSISWKRAPRSDYFKTIARISYFFCFS